MTKFDAYINDVHIDFDKEKSIRSEIDNKFRDGLLKLYKLKPIEDFVSKDQKTITTEYKENQNNFEKKIKKQTKEIITYFFNNNISSSDSAVMHYTKILDTSIKNDSQQVIVYKREYYKGDNKVKEETYHNNNKNIIRLTEFGDNFIKQYCWFAENPDKNNGFISKFICNDITIFENGHKKEVVKERCVQYDNTNHCLLINYEDSMDTFIDTKISPNITKIKKRMLACDNNNDCPLPYIDWSAINCDEEIHEKESGLKITKNRHFRTDSNIDNIKIDWINDNTFNKEEDNRNSEKEITKVFYFKDSLDEDNPEIDWSNKNTYEKTYDKTNPQFNICEKRGFENFIDSEGNPKIDWSHNNTYDTIYDKQGNIIKEIRRKYFQKLFENISKINLEPHYLNNNDRVKTALKKKLVMNENDFENIFNNVQIEQISDDTVQLKLTKVTDKFFPSPEPVILKSNYVASSSSNPTNNNVINNHSVSPHNQEKKSFSLWLIISSIMIIGVIGYLVYLYINKKRP